MNETGARRARYGWASTPASALAVAVGILCFAWPPAAAQPLPESLQLAELDGTQGGVISGVDRFDLAGYWMRGVGDVNGDGLDDFVVSAPQAGDLFEGEVYLFFGSRERRAAWSVQELDGRNGTILRGVAFGESSGVSVESAGDFDGDGFGDLVVGAPFASPGGRASAGAAYLVFGGPSFPRFIDLGSLGGQGVLLEGANPYDQAGLSVSGGGDVDGDGLSDLLVSAHRADGEDPNEGSVYVVFGRRTSPGSFNLGELDGVTGMTLHGGAEEDEAGFSVSDAGDINGDGFGDVVVGAFRADPGGRQKAGEVYLVYGGKDLPPTIDLGALNGSDGFTVRGIDEKDEAGFAVAGVGDMNGDGFDDIALSAPAASPDFRFVAGESYVVYGGPALPAALELAALDGTNGVLLKGADVRDQSGECVAGLGDIDNDGFDDLLIGATLGDPGGFEQSGEAYVVLGGPTLPSEVELASLDGSNGMRLEGVGEGDFAGFGCGGGGDFDGDGIDDILVGAPMAAPGPEATGAGYLVYGQSEATLQITGGCPGEVVITAGGLSPGGVALVLGGDSRGVSVLESGVCAGEEVDLSGALALASVAVGRSGELGLTRGLGAAGCGRWLQVVDVSSCRKSRAAPLLSQGELGAGGGLWKTAEP